jgi:signal transduction histidine kinase
VETVIVSLRLRVDGDTTLARQHLLRLVERCGFSTADQARVVSSLSEVARPLVGDRSEALLSYAIRHGDGHPELVIRLCSQGCGLSVETLRPSLVTPRRLLDHVEVENGEGGLEIVMRKAFPARRPVSLESALAFKREFSELGGTRTEAVRQQNYELEEALELLVRKDQELRQRLEDFEQLHAQLASTQTQLLQSEKMASLGQLVAGIAHEVNNPLAYVIANLHNVRGWLERLRPAQEMEPTEQRMWDKVESRTASMHEGLERIRTLVEKLRTFSRLDEGEFKVVDIHDAVESVLLFVNHRLDAIEVERDYQFPRPLACYPGQLTQVVMNVVSNAIDAMAGKGEISLSTRQDGNDFLLSVKDTGPGIAEHHLERLFEPFFTTKPLGQGTGLGLSISYGIMQTHRGSIRFFSRPGEGTECQLRVPLDLRP